jgi:hypothetical protein
MVIVFLPVIVTAQRWNVSGEVFYGTFKMKSMKEYQHGVRMSQAPYEFRTVDKFPAYAGYNLLAGYNISPRMSLGVRLQYTSTGGRVAYGDYSGKVSYDQLLHGYSIGLNSTYRLTKPSIWQAYFSFTAGAMRTSLHNVHNYQVLNITSGHTSYLRSYNYFFNPAVMLRRKLSNHFMVYANLGYEFQIHRAVRASNNKKQYLKTSNGRKDVIAEWDGIRTGAGISYRFGLSGKKEIND